MELKESDLVRAEEINSVKALHTKSLQMMRKMFEGNTAELEERCKERLSQLEADLELRRKVSEGEGARGLSDLLGCGRRWAEGVRAAPCVGRGACGGVGSLRGRGAVGRGRRLQP